ncbi:MAG TPA: UvrD-helicase domain-containing protein, partial [Bryobacteraceae bacterium]|nr:UvrD-helicase domain-containing protein [Bryobacteraceae bacterium]
DAVEQEKGGDALLQQLNRLRGMMLDRRLWSRTVREFEQMWTEYKRENCLHDFTDLIETAYRDVYVAPKNPSVIFADEAQDLNCMQLSLIRKWGERASYFILAGDDDQTIFSFTGATPDAMLKPDIPEDHKIILKQSYRVPRAVHRVADKLIQEVARRQEKVYLPRAEEGAVERLTRGTYRDTEHYILKTATEHLERGQTIMFLASCSYMLWNITHVLRKNGIPFHNPYRRTNGAWNPVRIGGRGTTASRIMALLVVHPDFGERHRPWTHGDLALWAEWLNAEGILKRGAKKKLTTFETSEQVTVEKLNEIFEPGALYSLLAAYEGDYHALLEWWRARVTATVHDRVQFAADIASKRGPRALLEKPQVIVGTIHSVKGGEADCSPPDEPILTTEGYVQIGKLDPAKHRLVSYTARTDKIRRGIVRNASRRDQEGYAFKTASRPYCGELVTIRTSSTTTRVTPNHHLIVRWAEGAKSKFVVYLMKRGEWWRIGHCQMFYGNRCHFGLGGRTKREGCLTDGGPQAEAQG